MEDQELKSMNQVHVALTALGENKEAIARVLKWARERFVGTSGGALASEMADQDSKAEKGGSEEGPRVDPGVRRLCQKDAEGNFIFTARDLKAKNQADAVKRIVYSVIYLYGKLMNSETTSRKTVVNPLLEKWRLYDGNTRGFMASDPGILKNGDLLSLDIHAAEEAEGFVRDMLDNQIQGSWKAGSKKTAKRNTPSSKPKTALIEDKTI